HAQREAEFARSIVQRLDRIDATTLSEDDRLTLKILRWENQLTIDGLPYFWYRFQVTPYSFRNLGIQQVFTMQRLTDADRTRTTVDITPQQIHDLGLREVERINREMQRVRSDVGFENKTEFHQFLKSDPRFFAKTPDEVGERLTNYLHKIEPHVPELFSRAPRARYDVQRLDPALEGGITFGYYQQPTATDPIGHYYYNGSRLNERNLLFARALIE